MGKAYQNGDTLETNATHFVHALIENNIQPGQRIVVGVINKKLEQAIRYLFSSHEALIDYDWKKLGPTFDDRTRYALSSVF